MIFLLAFGSTLIITFIFALNIANIKTLDQRLEIIDSCATMDELEKVRKVTYEKHMWYLLTFRDPKNLYK